jgi:hypothetical protein
MGRRVATKTACLAVHMSLAVHERLAEHARRRGVSLSTFALGCILDRMEVMETLVANRDPERGRRGPLPLGPFRPEDFPGKAPGA